MFGDIYPNQNKVLNTLPDNIKSKQGVFSNEGHGIKNGPLNHPPPQSFQTKYPQKISGIQQWGLVGPASNILDDTLGFPVTT
jgi:hypothetical protein